jgi:hypothetical protein
MARLFDDEHQPAPVPPGAHDIDALRQAARGCTACPLHKLGTQTVFGAPEEERAMAKQAFVDDLRNLAKALGERGLV